MPTPYRPGDDYEIVSYSVHDGDTIRAHLASEVQTHDMVNVGGWVTWESRHVETRRDLPGVLGRLGPSIRLVTLNTPELTGPHADAIRAATARAHLRDWLDQKFARGGLRVEVWPEEGAFGRMLGDVYSAADRANTASAYMLRLGWDPFLGVRS